MSCASEQPPREEEQIKDFLRHAVSHKVNSISEIYADIARFFDDLSNGKTSIQEFKYYSYGVNSLLQDNNFRGAEAILFEQENEKLYQVLLKMNLPIINVSTIAQNATNEELNQAAEAYLKLAELTGGNNEGSLAYCIGNEIINGHDVDGVLNKIQTELEYLETLIN